MQCPSLQFSALNKSTTKIINDRFSQIYDFSSNRNLRNATKSGSYINEEVAKLGFNNPTFGSF